MTFKSSAAASTALFWHKSYDLLECKIDELVLRILCSAHEKCILTQLTDIHRNAKKCTKLGT